MSLVPVAADTISQPKHWSCGSGFSVGSGSGFLVGSGSGIPETPDPIFYISKIGSGYDFSVGYGSCFSVGSGSDFSVGS